MHEVVAMRWVPSHEVLESHEDLYIVVRSQFHNVFPACLMRRRGSAVPREDPECHQVNVDGVAPVAVVLQDPDLRRPLPRAARTSFTLKNFSLMVHPPLSSPNIHLLVLTTLLKSMGGSVRKLLGTLLGSAASPFTSNRRIGVPGFSKPPDGPVPSSCAKRFTRKIWSPIL